MTTVKHSPGPSMTPSDVELIRQAQAGDLSAFEQLMLRYDRRVLTIAASYVQSSDEAKDIFQEVFIRVHRGLPKFQMKSEFGTWLFRITTNVCLTHRSKARKHRHVPLNGEGDDQEGDAQVKEATSEATTERHVNRSELVDRVRGALDRLSPRQRMVFVLKHYEGYKLREIAEMMTLAEGSVKKYLFEATARLRTELEDYAHEAHS